MDVKPGQLEKRRERDWKLSKCGEYQMGPDRMSSVPLDLEV